MPVMVGTYGWQSADWRGRLYPHGLPQRLWLEHHAQAFRTGEVDNAFYRLPRREVFEAWRARTPPDHVVTVKASRYLTHLKRLLEPGGADAAEPPIGWTCPDGLRRRSTWPYGAPGGCAARSGRTT